MEAYEDKVFHEMCLWKARIQRTPAGGSRLAKSLQNKINAFIPEKVHWLITLTIEKMVKAVLFGSMYTIGAKKKERSLQLKEAYVKRTARHYKNAATLEGVITGAGGILMGFADFPAFLAIKLKMLFEIATIYGYDVKDYKERLFILYVFKIAFSSQPKRQEIVKKLENWEKYSQTLPEEVANFDWKDFQLEYRDYLDLAKMAQLLPIIGAAVGAVANNKLTHQLLLNAMNCYRLRYFSPIKQLSP
ncbi:EcsC family protein [Olivibacter ginsenosidimutans]|uniref:EcsC family protein n=1 Tax=Olivibacter ginsenosidimutans TaxID=1176537 RepID=A0ABP9AF17_9SPHI